MLGKVVVTENARVQARSLGVAGNVDARIKKMVRRSAPCTHDCGNWRYENFVFDVEDGEVLSVVGAAGGHAPRKRKPKIYSGASNCSWCGGTMEILVGEEQADGTMLRVLRPCARATNPDRSRGAMLPTCDET